MPRNTAPAMDQIPYRLPLVIGATGHRDLRDEDIPALEGAVAKVIERLKRDYLKDTRWSCRVPGLRVLCRWLGLCVDRETPIIVLSSLAEGADRLIARIAMAHGAKLIAPLPLGPDEYRRDFEPGLKPDAAAEFDRMKSDALAAPVMRYANGNTPENVREESRRALQYREVGLFIVRHCHVLIALWNGDEHDPAVGGTAEVVAFKRDGIPLEAAASVRASLDAPEMGPVIHIVTPRAKPGGSVTEVEIDPWLTDFVARYRASHPLADKMDIADRERRRDQERPADWRERRQFESWVAFAAKAGLTCRFNREAAKLDASSDGKKRLDTSLSYLFDDPDKKLTGETAKICAMQLIPHWCGLYQIADTLAQERQLQFILDWRTLFGLGFLAIASFEVGTHLLFNQEWFFWLIGLYGVFFVSVFGWFFNARRHEHQERFLDYRALAEALRVAVFWKLVGIGWPTEKRPSSEPWSTIDLDSRDAVADAYPIRQPSELDWVKTCLRTLELLDADKSPAETNHRFDVEGHAWARIFWVNGQLTFFGKRARERDHHADIFEKRSLILVILSIAFAFALFAFDFFFFERIIHVGGQEIDWNHENWGHRIVILVIGLLPGVAAVWTGYAERLALKAQARQYDRMRVLFQRAQDLLESPQPGSFSLTRVLYAELGREAMEENAEWVAIYRQRPIRPPN
jgi:hypothetical protein